MSLNTSNSSLQDVNSANSSIFASNISAQVLSNDCSMMMHTLVC